MKESKGIYVTKKDIKQNLFREYHLYRIINNDFEDLEKRSVDVGVQYNCKKDNLQVCTCKNYPGVRRQHEARYFSTTQRPIYTYPSRSKSITDIGVGSVKALPKKKVKRVYLPETDNRGVGSTDLSAYFENFHSPRKPKHNKVTSYYDQKKTSSKCVGGVVENRVECVVSAKVSPIIHTKSGTTSPKEYMGLRLNTDLGINTIEKNFATTPTQMETKDFSENEAKPTTVTVIVKPIAKEAKDVAITEIKPAKSFSSESLIQQVHNLEESSAEKYVKPEVVENKIEKEQKKVTTKSKDKDANDTEKVINSDLKSTSLLRRRFQALRKTLSKKENRTYETKSSSHSIHSSGSVKNASVSSDPPSLVARSYSNMKTSKNPSSESNPNIQQCSKDMYKSSFEKDDDQKLPKDSMLIESQCGGVKGMFKLWGKKFNLDDESPINSKNSESPKSSFSKKKEKKEVPIPKIDSSATRPPDEKKKKNKFFLFKKKNKDKKAEKPKDAYKNKKGVTTGRCEVRDGLIIKYGGNTQPQTKEKKDKDNESKIESYGEIVRKDWLQNYTMNSPIDSQKSVKIRWNNNTYATSSSTIFELMENVYKGTGVILKSKSETASSIDECSYKSYHQAHNYVQEVEAWMIPRTILDHPIIIKNKKVLAPSLIPYKKNENLNQSTSNRKWHIEKSKAFSHRIEVVLHSSNLVTLKNPKSSEYLRIDIPKGFFSDTSIEEARQVKRLSDEELFKIIEYDTDSFAQTAIMIKPIPVTTTRSTAFSLLNTEDDKSDDLKKHENETRNVQVGDSPSPKRFCTRIDGVVAYESERLNTDKDRPPAYRDVVIQDSNVYMPKVCDVIGVGIITQGDLRINPKSILKPTQYLSEEDSDPVALSRVQEYCRHAGIDIDMFSKNLSDSHIKCCPGDSDGLNSSPNTDENFFTSSCLSSCSLVHCQIAEVEDGGRRKLPESPSKRSENLLYRIPPKDSLEVSKKRRMYATSNKSKWKSDDIESSSFMDYSDSALKLQEEKKKRKKTSSKRVALPENSFMNEILPKSFACDNEILSYSDLTRNSVRTVEQKKSPDIGLSSLHDSVNDLDTVNPENNEQKKNGSGFVNEQSNLLVNNTTNLEKTPSPTLDKEKIIKYRSKSDISQPAEILKTKSQSNVSFKQMDINLTKAQSNISNNQLEASENKSQLNRTQSDSFSKLTRSKSVVDIKMKEPNVVRTTSGSKSSQNIPNMNDTTSLSTPELPKSTRSSVMSLYPVEFKPSRNESQKLQDTLIPNTQPEKVPLAGNKTTPSSTTIILTRRQSSKKRISQQSSSTQKNFSSTQKLNVAQSSKPSILKQPSMDLKRAQGSCSEIYVNNGPDKSYQLISGPYTSCSCTCLSSNNSVSNSINAFKLPDSVLQNTIQLQLSHHQTKPTELFNTNIEDSPPFTSTAEKDSKKGKKDKQQKEAKKAKSPKTPKEKKGKGKPADAPGGDVAPAAGSKESPATGSTEPPPTGGEPIPSGESKTTEGASDTTQAGEKSAQKKGKKDKDSKKGKKEKSPTEPKTATRGPLAHPPAVMVPGKPRCVPLVKYANPPHYKDKSPLRPRSPAGPKVPGAKEEPVTLPAPNLPSPGTQTTSSVPLPPSEPFAPSPPTVLAEQTPPLASGATMPPSAPVKPEVSVPTVAPPSKVPEIKGETTLAAPNLPSPGTQSTSGVPLPPSEPLTPSPPKVLPEKSSPLVSGASMPPSAPLKPEVSVPKVAPSPPGPVLASTAAFTTTEKAMQFNSLLDSITQTHDFGQLSKLDNRKCTRENCPGESPELNANERSISEPSQPTERRSASILSTNTIVLPVSGPENPVPTPPPPAASPDKPAEAPPAGVPAPEETKSPPGEAMPASDATKPKLDDPTKIEPAAKPVQTLPMLEPVLSVRVPCPAQRADHSTPCPYSTLPCPHSPTCNPPCNIPCYHPKVKKRVEAKPKPKKISHCNLEPCVDLAALEKEKQEIEKKIKAQFSAKKSHPRRLGKCTSMCKTPPCYKPLPPQHMHRGTVMEPKCASACKTSTCNPRCRDFPWARVTQQASVASVHFADNWQDDYDKPQKYDESGEDEICDAYGNCRDASIRTDQEEKVIKVDKGLNYKQVPIYEQGPTGPAYRPSRYPNSFNPNTQFQGYDYNRNPQQYSNNQIPGQNFVYGYGPNYGHPLYDSNPDRLYANYSQYQNYEPQNIQGTYYGQNYEPTENFNAPCPNYGQNYDYEQNYEEEQYCDDTQNCYNYLPEDDAISMDEEVDVEFDDDKCAPISAPAGSSKRHKVRKPNICKKDCSYKPDDTMIQIDEKQKKKKKEKDAKAVPKEQPEYVTPKFKHPCKPIQYGKDVCPPPACPPAKECPFTCTSRGKIFGIHLRQEPNLVPKKTCDPGCKAWKQAELTSKKGYSIWKDLCSKEHDDVLTVKSVEAVISPHQQPGIGSKVMDADGVTLIERRNYVTHHSTPVLNNVFERNQPVTVNDMPSVERLTPETKKEEIETSLTNMFEINFNLRVTKGDKTTEISIANDDDTERTIKGPKGTQEVFTLKSDNHKTSGEHSPNDINIRIMIKSYKPKSEKTFHTCAVSDFSKEISKKFQTVSKGSKLTGTEEITDNVYSVHRATVNLTADSKEISKIESENINECPVAVLSNPKVTEQGDAMLSVPDEIEVQSSGAEKIDLPSDVKDILNTCQDVTDNTPDVDETLNTCQDVTENTLSEQVTTECITKVNEESTEQILTEKVTIPENTDLQIIIKKDNSDFKSESSNMVEIRLYKSDPNLRETETEPDISSCKTSIERTDLCDKNDVDNIKSSDNLKTSDDNVNFISSEEPILEDMALKTSEEPTSESQDSKDGVLSALSEDTKEMLDEKSEKKEMLKAIFENASCVKKPGKNRIRRLKNMLKAILTSDSSDPEETAIPSLAEDITYQSLKPNIFKNSDSLNNFLKLSGKESVDQIQCNTEAASAQSGGDSEWSIERGETPQQCICSAVAARLKSYDKSMNDVACCCQKNTKADQQISCDLIPTSDIDSSSIECVDVEIQNKFLSSRIVITQSVEISAQPSYFLAPIADEIELKGVGSKEKKIRDITIKKSKMSFTHSGILNDLRKFSKTPKLGISDEDRIIFLETQPIGFSNALKSRRRKEKFRPVYWQQPADILQLYETKKAVLEIYTERTVTEDGERLIAKLPKFIYDKENDVTKCYRDQRYKGFRSLCKTNIVMMSITR